MIFVCGVDGYDLRKESETFDDILQFDFGDSYKNLTLKMMNAYGYFLQNTAVKEIIVINDDTIVDAEALKKVLYNQVSLQFG